MVLTLKSIIAVARSRLGRATQAAEQDFHSLQTDPILPSRRLERIASVLVAGRSHEVGDTIERLGQSGFGFVILVLALPALVPIPGPFGLVFGFCLALVSLQVLFGAKQLWLPQQLRAMKVDGGM
ncbi:MAG: exopolysaccharide biosynthesis protein, partial [Rhizobiaceae bacterium]